MAVTGVNKQMNFQGRLLNAQGAVVPDGTYNIQFKIYQDGTGAAVGNPGGTLKWTEDWLNASGKGVLVKNGYLSVQLGTVNPFESQVDWNQDTLWLSMNIAGTNATCASFSACSPDGEMVPMKRLSAVAYAMNATMLGGKTAENFLQIAQGLQTDVTSNTASIYINKTSTGNFLQYQQAGSEAFAVTNSGDILFGNNLNHTISINTSPAGVIGRDLTVAAGSANPAGGAAAGGNLILQGGNAAGTGNNNGGNVTLAGGVGVGTGYNGIVNIGASSYSAGTMPACATDCTITQSLVDSYGTVIVSSLDPTVTITLPAPRNQTTGRIIYITTSSDSTDFSLAANSGINNIKVTMKANTTATMIWNGSAWTPGGASNAITLQATYDNGTNPSTTPEIKLDSIRGTIDIQDADTSIGQDILTVRASQPGDLGTKLFGVGHDGQVTIQGTTNNSSAFRVLDQYGYYSFNINNANGYTIDNSIKATDNEISNPGFEAGGNLANGEEGWFGPAVGAIVNSNARTGNYALQAVPNGGDQYYYAGSYREVTPGKSYAFTGHVKQVGANGDAGLRILWYGKDKNYIGAVGSGGGSSATSYTQLTLNYTAPANAVYARVAAYVQQTATAGTYYFDDFSFRSSSVEDATTFQNTTNTTTAFRIQSAGAGQTLFTANTTDNILKIGDNLGTNTNTTLLVLDHTTVDPATLTGRDGGMYYNAATNSLKAVIGGSVVDICTTAVTCSGYSASAGSVIQLQTNSPGTTQIGHFNITGTGILSTLKSHDSTTAAGENLTIKAGSTTAAGAKGGNLVIDSGSGPGGSGNITIGHAGVNTTMAGGLAIQGSGIAGASVLSLGSASAVAGSLTFASAAGSNAVTLRGPTTAGDGTAYALTFADKLVAGCMKVNSSGEIYYQDCGVGLNFDLQDAYDNSPSPAEILLTQNKDLKITAQNIADGSYADPNILFDLQCVSNCGTNGRFAVQNAGTDVLSVDPNGRVTIDGTVQIGSTVADGTVRQLILDSFATDNEIDSGVGCAAANRGALYYNTNMQSIRGCVDGTWVDISNPDTLGLLTFGVIPSSGDVNNAYDLPSLSGGGGVNGPCKVYWVNNQTVAWQGCTAYSGGRRVTIGANPTGITVPALANGWTHLCLSGTRGAPAFSTPNTDPTEGLPAWSAKSPILCLADIKMTPAGTISAIYDTRTFSSTMKEAVNTASAVQLGTLVDAGTNGAMAPARSGSKKLYGTVIVADSSRPSSSGQPNAIVATVGPAWIKANNGSSGSFVIAGSTNDGYGTTITSIPNNSFYYSAGNTRTSYTAPTGTTPCSNANSCSGSLYVNFVVR